MYIVVSVEHTDSFDSIPMLLGKFDTREEAEEYRKEAIKISLDDFPYEKNDDGFLYTENEAGDIDYSYVITIMEVK